MVVTHDVLHSKLHLADALPRRTFQVRPERVNLGASPPHHQDKMSNYM